MLKKIIITCLSLFFILIISADGQVHDENIRLGVLKEDKIGETFVFGKWAAAGGDETHLKYLGEVKTRSGNTYKIMTSVWFWGLSHRATPRIVIFNTKNQYVGDYGLGSTDELPAKLKNGKLISRYGEVDFRFGIPKQISIGDVYTFESN